MLTGPLYGLERYEVKEDNHDIIDIYFLGDEGDEEVTDAI